MRPDPETIVPRDPERFWSKVDFTPECWEWAGARMPNGYGTFSSSGHRRYAHRVAYRLVRGEIPEGLQLDHLCRNRACVNPAHLEPVTCRENLMRGETIAAANASKVQCPKGHPYEGDNLIINVDGSRRCRICRDAYNAARSA